MNDAPFSLFMVVELNGGTHEPQAVYSVWTTQAEADKERARLTRVLRPSEGFEFVVETVTANLSSDTALT